MRFIDDNKIRDILLNRPNDIVTEYDDKIKEVYNKYIGRLNSDDVTSTEMTSYINSLTELYKLENESLGLSFTNKRGKRYMNFLMSWPVETVKQNALDEHPNQVAHFFLLDVIEHYLYGVNSNLGHPLQDVPLREAIIVDGIFSNEKSREILERNPLGYDYISYKYKSEADKKYCKAVLKLFKEITIRTFNYKKYIAGPDYPDSTDKDVEELYERLSNNRDRDKEYADKGLIGKTLHKIIKRY